MKDELNDLPNMPRLGLTDGQCYFDTDTKFTYCWDARAQVWLKMMPAPDARDDQIKYLEAVLRQIASYAGTETAAATGAKWASEALVKSANWPSTAVEPKITTSRDFTQVDEATYDRLKGTKIEGVNEMPVILGDFPTVTFDSSVAYSQRFAEGERYFILTKVLDATADRESRAHE